MVMVPDRGSSKDKRRAWTTSGVEDLGSGVFRVPVPLPGDALVAVNVYVIVDVDGIHLIDAGQVLAGAADQLANSLRSIGYELDDVHDIFVTHYHRDHYTLAVELRRRHRIEVNLGDMERANLEALRVMASGGNEFGTYADLRRTGALILAPDLNVDKRPDMNEWEDPDHWIGNGAQLSLPSRSLQAIHTPGHTRGHFVFYDAENSILFAGDHVLPDISPSIGFEPATNSMALRDYMESLHVVRSLPDARLLPAHGPVSESTHWRVDELLAHHDLRLKHTFRAVLDGGETAYEVAAALKWTRRDKDFADLGPFDKYFACTETAAHLELLRDRGDLRLLPAEDGADHYQPVS